MTKANAENSLGRAPFRLLVTALIVLTGCATVPPASVDLSRKIGEEIGRSRVAHLSTLDAFYRNRKEENDGWVEGAFLSRALERANAGLAAACAEKKDESPDCPRMGAEDIGLLIRSTIEYRDSLQRLLEKNRDEAFRIVDEHYASLSAANAGVTAMLASAVDVRQAGKDAADAATRTTGIDIDYDAIQAALDEFLAGSGKAGLKISDLEKKLAEILARSKGG